MSFITGLATAVIASSLLATAALIAIVTYYASGAPAARYEMRSAVVDRIKELQDGPFTVPQRIRSRVKASFDPKHLFRVSSGVDYVAWARAVQKDYETAQDGESRSAVYAMLAATQPDEEATTRRLWARETALIDAVVSTRQIESVTNLEELYDVVRKQDRLRWLTIVRQRGKYFERTIVGPLCAKALDYIGRGTAFGLLLGAMFANGKSMETLLNVVSMTSVIGGALGSVLFVAFLAERLPPRPVPGGDQIAALERMRCAHPRAVAISFPVLAAVVVGSSIYLGQALSAITQSLAS